MAKKRLYPYCEDSDIPSIDVVEKFAEKKRPHMSDYKGNIETDDYNSAEEAFYQECEALYAVKRDWTAVLASMNID